MDVWYNRHDLQTFFSFLAFCGGYPEVSTNCIIVLSLILLCNCVITFRRQFTDTDQNKTEQFDYRITWITSSSVSLLVDMRSWNNEKLCMSYYVVINHLRYVSITLIETRNVLCHKIPNIPSGHFSCLPSSCHAYSHSIDHVESYYITGILPRVSSALNSDILWI